MADLSVKPRPESRGAWFWVVLAILCAALALWAGQRSSRIQGPSTLTSLPDGSVWLVVDDALWLMGPSGQTLLKHPWRHSGLSHAPATLAYQPAQQELLAMARGQSVVYVLHPRTAQPLRQITLQWPAAAQAQLTGALWLAAHDDGRMAVATGAGHAVLLFDAQGRHLATTPADTYRYTNDLWWQQDQVWTTDTNGQALVKLDGRNLQPLQRLPLNDEHPWRYTALAKPHPHAGISAMAPLATLSRLDGQMKRGRVVQVWADGREEALPLGPEAEPLDLAWASDQLLVVDGHSWRIRRFDTLNQGLADFGDETARDALAQLKRQKEQLDDLHRTGLIASIVLLAIGVAWLIASRWRHDAPLVAGTQTQARFLGTPVLPTHQLMGRGLQLMAPLLGAVLLLMALRVLITPGMAEMLGKTLLLVVFTGLGLLSLGLMVLQVWWWRRLARQPEQEAVLNALPVRWLLRHADWSRVALPDEHVRETWLLRHWWRPRWLVLTNQRLLVFKVQGLGRRTLEHAWPRKQVRKVQLLAWQDLGWMDRLKMYAAVAGTMRIHLHDGQIIEGGVLSPLTVERVQAQLSLRHHAPSIPPHARLTA
jgi:hypothetical protein